MVLCTHAHHPCRRLSPCRSSGHSRRWIRRPPTTWTNPNPHLSPCSPSFSKICSSPSYCRRHRIDPVATGLSSPRQDVHELPRRLLLRPPPLNQDGPHRTLVIELFPACGRRISSPVVTATGRPRPPNLVHEHRGEPHYRLPRFPLSICVVCRCSCACCGRHGCSSIRPRPGRKPASACLSVASRHCLPLLTSRRAPSPT